MGNPAGAFHHFITLQSLTVFSLIAVFAADHVQVRDDGRPPFTCGHLQDIQPPFRRRGDPLECGVEAYELRCTSSKATIHINAGTYYVTAINYTGSYFWAMDPNFSTGSSCPLPLWNHVPYLRYDGVVDSDSPSLLDLVTRSPYRACFANCSRAVTNKSAYKPVACQSAKNSHVYAWVSYSCMVKDLEPYCGCLGMISLEVENSSDRLPLWNASYADMTQFISKGFTVLFPVDTMGPSDSVRKNINICLNNSIR